MNKKRLMLCLVPIVTLLVLAGCGGSAEVKPGTTTAPVAQPVSKPLELYRDRNGYFAALPPEGWSQEDYPSETIRSKVAFHHPENSNIVIRILASAAPSENYTLEDLYIENQQKIPALQRQYSNAIINLTKGKMGEYQTVVMRTSIPNLLEQEITQLVEANVYYSIAFSTITKTQFENNYKTVEKFLREFLVLKADRRFSEEELRATLVARSKRLAELNEQMGQIDEALRFVREGLAIDPDNTDLKSMESRLLTKKGSK